MCGAAALLAPNGTRVHRRWGKGYVTSWAFLFTSGLIIDTFRPGISVFQLFNIAGIGFAAFAYAAVRWRDRVGHNWLAYHYI